MYEEYYGFVQPPFSLTPDPRFLYRSESHEQALQQVWQAIRRKEGFIVLTGDIGTGKTTLCRTILEQFDETTFTALILNPFLTLEELLREVLLSYGVASRDALNTGRLATATKHELVRTLHDFLLSLAPINGSAVLIIDEAQHLSPDVLEEIRVLSSLETADRKLLLIVLVGQLNLLDVLRDARLRQLDQRISIRCFLEPLTREGVEAYITHRLTVARGSTTVTFTRKAFDLLYALSAGVPRVINLICDRALMAGAEARTGTITDALVREAAAVIGLSLPPGHEHLLIRPRSPVPALRVVAPALIVLLLSAAAAYYVLGGPLGAIDRGSLPTVATPPPTSMGVAVPGSPPDPETLPTLTPPPIDEGAFSVVVGTYDTPREAEQTIKTLRDRGLPVYAVDIRFDDDVRRRRVLVGRYAAREDGQKARADLLQDFGQARLIYGWYERVP